MDSSKSDDAELFGGGWKVFKNDDGIPLYRAIVVNVYFMEIEKHPPVREE